MKVNEVNTLLFHLLCSLVCLLLHLIAWYGIMRSSLKQQWQTKSEDDAPFAKKMISIGLLVRGKITNPIQLEWSDAPDWKKQWFQTLGKSTICGGKKMHCMHWYGSLDIWIIPFSSHGLCLWLNGKYDFMNFVTITYSLMQIAMPFSPQHSILYSGKRCWHIGHAPAYSIPSSLLPRRYAAEFFLFRN